MAERHEFLWRIDARGCGDVLDRAVRTRDAHGDDTTRLQCCAHSQNVEALPPGNLERRGVCSLAEFERQDPHVDEVAAVNPLEAFRDHDFHAEQQRALCRPVAR